MADVAANKRSIGSHFSTTSISSRGPANTLLLQSNEGMIFPTREASVSVFVSAQVVVAIIVVVVNYFRRC